MYLALCLFSPVFLYHRFLSTLSTWSVSEPVEGCGVCVSQTINTVIRNWCKVVEQQGADGVWMQFPYISCPAGGLHQVEQLAAVWVISPSLTQQWSLT